MGESRQTLLLNINFLFLTSIVFFEVYKKNNGDNMKDELLKIFKGEEENLTKKETNIFIWAEFLGEEEDLTDEEKKAWEVIK